MTELTDQELQDMHRKRVSRLSLFVMILVGISLVTVALWAFYFRFEEYTDDAYVQGNIMALTPQIDGMIMSINTDETQYVKKGQVLVEIDPTDRKLALDKALAELAQGVRDVVKMFDNVKQLSYRLQVNEAEFEKTYLDYEHRASLIDIGGVSQEDYEHATLAFQAAAAQVEDTRFALRGAAALVINTVVQTHPNVLKLKQVVKEAYVNLMRCKIIAPVDGFIAKRSCQVGEVAMPNQPLLALVPLNELWVNANYKEVQLKKMRVGQVVEMTSDIYGHFVKFKGRVVGFSAGTGSAFSSIPPQNATGNWIKIVQRLPVRISLDPEDLAKYPLRVGLSMRVHVGLHDQSGERLGSLIPHRPLYFSNIYPLQLNGADELADAVILENMSGDDKDITWNMKN